MDVTPIREGDSSGGVTPFVLDLLTSFATASRRHEYRLLTAAHNHHAFSSYEALGMTRCCVEGTARPLGLRAGGGKGPPKPKTGKEKPAAKKGK